MKIATATGVIAGSTVATSHAIDEMTIFHDTIYIILCVIGLTLSILGYLHALLTEEQGEITKNQKIGGFIKAFITGAIITPLTFLLLDDLGDKYFQARKYLGAGANDIYFFASLIIGYFSVPIWDFLLSQFKLSIFDRIRKRRGGK